MNGKLQSLPQETSAGSQANEKTISIQIPALRTAPTAWCISPMTLRS